MPHRRDRRRPSAPLLLVGVLLGVLLAGCGVAPSASGGDPGGPEATGVDAGSSAPPGTGSPLAPGKGILGELPAGRDSEVFDRRYFASLGDLSLGGTTSDTSTSETVPAGDTGSRGALLAVGMKGDQAVAYWCDGEKGVWFTGAKDASGNTALRAVAGEGSVTLTGVGEGLRAELTGPATGAATGDASLASVADAFMRVETTTPDGDKILGGVILRDGIMRGSVTVTPGPSGTGTPTGTSGGASGPSGGTPPLTSQTPSDAPGVSSFLTISVADQSVALASGVKAQVAALSETIKALRQQIEVTQRQLDALRRERQQLADKLAALPADSGERAGLQARLAQIDALIAQQQRAVTALQGQIDSLQRQVEVQRQKLTAVLTTTTTKPR